MIFIDTDLVHEASTDRKFCYTTELRGKESLHELYIQQIDNSDDFRILIDNHSLADYWQLDHQLMNIIAKDQIN